MIRLESDGTGNGTKVIDVETGLEIKGVSKVIYKVSAGHPSELILFFPIAEIRALGEKFVRYETLRGKREERV